MTFHLSIFMVKLKHLFKLIFSSNTLLFKIAFHIFYLLLRSSYFISQVLNFPFVVWALVQLDKSFAPILLFPFQHFDFTEHIFIMLFDFSQFLCHLSNSLLCVLTFLHTFLKFLVLSFVKIKLIIRIFKFFLLHP